jgi:hypothetical protein
VFGAGAMGGQAFERRQNPRDFWLSIKAEFPGRTVPACKKTCYGTFLPRTCFAVLCRQRSLHAQPLVRTDQKLTSGFCGQTCLKKTSATRSSG